MQLLQNRTLLIVEKTNLYSKDNRIKLTIFEVTSEIND
jgi:hypothetical protein